MQKYEKAIWNILLFYDFHNEKKEKQTTSSRDLNMTFLWCLHPVDVVHNIETENSSSQLTVEREARKWYLPV